MQKTLLIGRLTADAQVNNVNGRNVVNMSVAVNRSYKDAQGNKKEFVDYFNCAYWTDKIGIVPYLKKGIEIYVEGEVGAKTYTKQSGETVPQLTLNVKQIQLLGSKQGNSNGSSDSGDNGVQIPDSFAGGDDSGLPF